MNRRSFFKRLGAGMAGAVVACLPTKAEATPIESAIKEQVIDIITIDLTEMRNFPHGGRDILITTRELC